MFRRLVQLLETFMGKRYLIQLSDVEREKATRLSECPAVPARVRYWAAVLLAAHEGMSDQQIASRVGVSVATVQRTRRRCVAAGFEAAIGWTGEIPIVDRNGPTFELGWLDSSLRRCLDIEGALGAAIVDYEKGVCLGSAGGVGLDLTVAATSNADVVRAKVETIRCLQLNDSITDILVTLTSQYHLIRVISSRRGLFFYVILDRRNGNLAMARHQLGAIEPSRAE